MSLLTDVEDKRNFSVPEGREFVLDMPAVPHEERVLRTLDDLSEAINLIDPETFQRHVNADKNDFAAWVEHVFGEAELAATLRAFPTPLRMMVAIERFLRGTLTPLGQKTAPEAPAAPAAPAPAPHAADHHGHA